MPKRKQPEIECIVTKPKLPNVDSLPRELDTFWRAKQDVARSTVSGHKVLRSNWMNKSSAFTIRERQLLNIHGLIPVAVRTLEQQVAVCAKVYATFKTDFTRHLYLTNLEETNSKLFYNLLLSEPKTYMPIFSSSNYTYAVNNFSSLFMTMRGMYITIRDRGHIYEVLRNWPLRHRVRYLIVTNGHSILKMGDQGVHGAPVVFYKVYQNVVLGGIAPENCLPIMLDVGTDNEALLNDPSYVGLPIHRVTGDEFYAFFEEFTTAVLRLFGPRAIILTKDFSPMEAAYLLDRYGKQQCFMDMSLQIRGVCGLAALLGALKITDQKFTAYKLLFYGTGNFIIGMAQMCMAYMKRMGLDDTAAKERIWFCDDKGLIVNPRCDHKVPDELMEFRQRHPPIESLLEIVETIQPNVLVGYCAQPNVFTKEIIKAMEKNAQTPIIFAMSSPVELAECSASDAYVYTKGRCVFVSADTLPPLKYANKPYEAAHCCLHYVLCGIIMGVSLTGLTSVPEELFLVVAERLANLVWPTDLAKHNVFPPERKMRCVNLQIASGVFSYAYRRRLATLWPEPSNPMHYIESMLFNPNYEEVIQKIYCPKEQHIGTSESLKYYKGNV